MSWVADVLDGLGVTGRDHGTSFPDGAAFRIEIPSVEGPKVLEAVLRAAEAEGITVNRVSQGSGAVLMRAVELRDMAQAGLEAGVTALTSNIGNITLIGSTVLSLIAPGQTSNK